MGGLRHLLLVGAGGFAGSLARYLLSAAVVRLVGVGRFPWATLVVNVAGCLAIGLVAGYAEARELAQPELRLFLLIGFFGAFTTFSTFGYETLALLQAGRPLPALANVALQVSLGLGATWLGWKMAVV